MSEDDEITQVVMHPALMPAFKDWLATRRLHLMRIPSEPDDLRTYVVSPDQDLWEERWCGG